MKLKETDSMKKLFGTKIIAIGLACIFSMTACSQESPYYQKVLKSNKETEIERKMKEASNDPFGKYPETVTYTLGKIGDEGSAGMPKGDTFENNAYTRYLKEQLNIQNEVVFSGSGSDYQSMVVTAITSGIELR